MDIDIRQFSSFKELVASSINGSDSAEILQLTEKIFNTSYPNQIWIGEILDFLNNNNEGKEYSEYYLESDGNYGTRNGIYRIISSNEDIPYSITDGDIEVLKRLKAQPKFILYDYEEESTIDIFGYYRKERTLRKCIESIGMTDELVEHLCEFCFDRVKQARDKDLGHHRFNPDLWRPVISEHPPKRNGYPRHETHHGFVEFQPLSERYQVPGLLPTTDEMPSQLVKKSFGKKPY